MLSRDMKLGPTVSRRTIGECRPLSKLKCTIWQWKNISRFIPKNCQNTPNLTQYLAGLFLACAAPLHQFTWRSSWQTDGQIKLKSLPDVIVIVPLPEIMTESSQSMCIYALWWIVPVWWHQVFALAGILALQRPHYGRGHGACVRGLPLLRTTHRERLLLRHVSWERVSQGFTSNMQDVLADARPACISLVICWIRTKKRPWDLCVCKKWKADSVRTCSSLNELSNFYFSGQVVYFSCIIIFVLIILTLIWQGIKKQVIAKWCSESLEERSHFES